MGIGLVSFLVRQEVPVRHLYPPLASEALILLSLSPTPEPEVEGALRMRSILREGLGHASRQKHYEVAGVNYHAKQMGLTLTLPHPLQATNRSFLSDTCHLDPFGDGLRRLRGKGWLESQPRP